MTNLAAKNNALIVKDGKIAENCGCCGGWYCCQAPACAADTVASVTATFTVPSYLRQTYWNQTSPWALKEYTSVGVDGSALSGVYTLTRVGNTNQWSRPASSCRGVSITFTLNTPASPSSPISASGTASFNTFGFTSEYDEQYKTPANISCTLISSGVPTVRSPLPGTDGTWKSEGTRQNIAGAFATGTACGGVPLTMQESGALYFEEFHYPYGYSVKPVGTRTVIQAIGPDYPQWFLRFDVQVT